MKSISRFRLLVSFLIAAASSVQAADVSARPKVGLVLGGGGARGAAHIGVLDVLEKLRVPVDCVAGTSMGALIAGAWVAGMSPEAMRASLATADWSDMFVDNPEYSEMSPRNKSISRYYMPGSESGVSGDGVRYQGGVVAGQKIKLFLNQLVQATQGERRIEQLPLPLSIVATDIGTGERVVFREGQLSQIMRASMSVPGLLAPVEYAGRKLVDGGLVDNLPVAEVRERCQADVVIAVDVSSPLLKVEEVGSLLSVSAQMIGILTEQNVSRSRAMLKAGDIYIKPDLEGIWASDFALHTEAAARGQVAAETLEAKLAALSLKAEAYAAWRQRLDVQQREPIRIDEVQVVGLQRVNPGAVERFLKLAPGGTLRAGDIDRDLLQIYGDGHYESVDYAVHSSEGRNILRVMPMEKSWGPDYLRFGVSLEADNRDGSSFGLRAAYHRTWINPLGGELLYHAELGSNNRLGVNYYQPFDARQDYFFEGLLGFEQERINVFQDKHRIAQYKATEGRVGAWLGRNMDFRGTARLGWLQRDRSYRRDIGVSSLPNADANFGGWQAALEFDRFDRMYFPTRGWAARLSYFDSPKLDYSRVDADVRGAFTLVDTVFNARLNYIGSPRGRLPVFDAGRLGGFLNMTAFSPNQLQGDDIRYASLRTEQIVGRLPLGLRGDMRVGLAFEAARLGRRLSETRQDDWLNSTAIYLGGQTPLGQAYLGFAYSTSGVSNVFLFIGTH